jgi:uncharacterized protein (TIGR03118 family)
MIPKTHVAVRACALVLAVAAFVAPRAAAAVEKGIPVIPPGSAYRQANLVSDVAGVALLQDPLLVNPWGIARTGSSPFWIANDGTSTSTLYREDLFGNAVTINPTLPSVTIPGGLPTGIVNNPSAEFIVDVGAASGAASFLFASITGNLAGWNTNVPAGGSTTATIESSLPGHVYTGLAFANNGTNHLYAADFAAGKIDVFSGTWVLAAPASFPFSDPTIPTTVGNVYHAHNIQNLGGSLYVTYAKVGPDGLPVNGAGNGFVRRFNANGVRDLTFGINNGALDAPWGLAIAPASFGIFGGALLVGNFADNGAIHAYNPSTGAFLGTLQDESGNAYGIDQLWGLVFGNGGAGGDVDALYFTAGIGKENHGLFGSLRPTTATATSLIEFSDNNYTVNEYLGQVEITVLRSGDLSLPASVRYAAYSNLQPFSANAADYGLPPATLSFAAGQSSRTFTIAITRDGLREASESFILVMHDASGSALASADSGVTILDPSIFGNRFE